MCKRGTQLLLSLGMLMLSHLLHAQCSVTAWATPTIISTDNSFGTYPFNNTANASASDNQYAVASATVSVLTGNSQYLKASGFGWALPAAASVCGVEVEIEKSASNVGLFTSVRDEVVQLIKDGIVTGSNKATSTNWTTSDVVVTYGSEGDTWGNTWTVADVNDADFGVVFSSRLNGLVSLLPSARVDQIRMRVHYQVSLALEEISFTVRLKEDYPNINFQLTEIGRVDTLSIEKVADNGTVRTLKSYSDSELLPSIEYSDQTATAGRNYYRLRIVSKDNSVNYSAVKFVTVELPGMLVVGNPMHDVLEIRHQQTFRQVVVYNSSGQKILARTWTSPQKNVYMPLPGAAAGLYLVCIDDKRRWIIRR